MKELPGKLAAAPPAPSRAARGRTSGKSKRMKNGKAKIPPPDPLLFAFPPKRSAFFAAVDFYSID